jgi:hypothetical protein
LVCHFYLFKTNRLVGASAFIFRAALAVRPNLDKALFGRPRKIPLPFICSDVKRKPLSPVRFGGERRNDQVNSRAEIFNKPTLIGDPLHIGGAPGRARLSGCLTARAAGFAPPLMLRGAGEPKIPEERGRAEPGRVLAAARRRKKTSTDQAESGYGDG